MNLNHVLNEQAVQNAFNQLEQSTKLSQKKINIRSEFFNLDADGMFNFVRDLIQTGANNDPSLRADLFDCISDIGRLYHEGDRKFRSTHTEVFTFLECAAENEHADSQYVLGFLLMEEGMARGTPPYDKVASLWERASTKNHIKAMTKLAELQNVAAYSGADPQKRDVLLARIEALSNTDTHENTQESRINKEASTYIEKLQLGIQNINNNDKWIGLDLIKEGLDWHSTNNEPLPFDDCIDTGIALTHVKDEYGVSIPEWLNKAIELLDSAVSDSLGIQTLESTRGHAAVRSLHEALQKAKLERDVLNQMLGITTVNTQRERLVMEMEKLLNKKERLLEEKDRYVTEMKEDEEVITSEHILSQYDKEALLNRSRKRLESLEQITIQLQDIRDLIIEMGKEMQAIVG